MPKDDEHLFTGWLKAVDISSLLKCLFKSFPHLKTIGLFIFLLILYYGYKIYGLYIFSPVFGLSFNFLNGFFKRAKVFNFVEIQCMQFIFMGPAL